MAKKAKIKETVGIDIGTHSIKLVHLKVLHDGFKLLDYEVRSTIPAGMEYATSDLRPERFAPVLSSMLSSLKINPKKIKHLVTSIGGEDISIKQIKTIFLPDEELESALFFEAKKHLPINGADMILDYQVLSIEEKTNNMNILLSASTKQKMNEHSEILTSSGCVPGIVDVDPLGVVNSFIFNTFVEDGVYVLLNIGAQRTNMVIYGPKAKYFSRDVPWGGYHFTKDIMTHYEDFSFEKAEEYKLEHGLKKDSKESEISLLDITEKKTEEELALEIRRSLRFYVKEAGNSDFKKIYIMGGSAKLKGLPEYLEAQLKIPTEIFNPFTNLEMPEKFRDKQDPQLALALGLAMRLE